MQSPGRSDNSGTWCRDFTYTSSRSPHWVCHFSSAFAFAGSESCLLVSLPRLRICHAMR